MIRYGSSPYLISEDGKVFSELTNKFLKPRLHKGYYVINLIKPFGTKSIHRLVAEVYLTSVLNKEQINHIDGNKLNNHVSNLEWCDCSENQKHKYQLKLACQTGELNGNVKLTETEVKEIRRLGGTMSNLNLSKLFNVEVSSVQKILARKTWKHIS